jgi:hypothetical protein
VRVRLVSQNSAFAWGCVLAHPAVVEMPETAVDEDDFAAAGEDEIGVAREFAAARGAVQAIAVSLRVQ